MLSGVRPELLEFCQPWLAGEPRLLLACQFSPEGTERERFLAVNVLMRELAQSVIGVSERRVAEARLAWWAEEAKSWADGHPRHPLAYGMDYVGSARSLRALVAQSNDWLLAAAPEQASALTARVDALAAASDQLHSGEMAWRLPWLGLMLRLTLSASTPLTSVLPMDSWARHGLKRSLWPELEHGQRCQLLADLVSRIDLSLTAVSDPALAVLQHLERNWLADAARRRPQGDRIGLGEVFSAWRAARRSRG